MEISSHRKALNIITVRAALASLEREIWDKSPRIKFLHFKFRNLGQQERNVKGLQQKTNKQKIQKKKTPKTTALIHFTTIGPLSGGPGEWISYIICGVQ